MTSAGFSLRDFALAYTGFVSRHAGAIGGFDNYQIALSFVLLAGLCGLAWLDRGGPGKAARWCPAWLYGVLLILALFCIRLPALLAGMMNPDEAEFLAAGMKLRHDPVFWRAFDSTTSGPLNFFAPALMNLFGFRIDFATARLMNVLCVGGAIAIMYPISRCFMEDRAARLTPLPALGAAMQFRQNDFLHFSSECVPALLIAAATWLLVSAAFGGRAPRLRYLALGAVAAILPLSKLQAAPVAAILAAMALVNAFLNHGEQKWRLTAWLAAGMGSVFALLLLYLAAFGVYGTFRQSFILSNLLYAGNSSYANNGTPATYTLSTFASFCRGSTDLYWYEFSAAVCLLLAPAELLRGGKRGIPAISRRGVFLCALVVSLLAASAYAVYRPMREFPHYLVFLIFPICLLEAGLFAAVLAARAPARGSRRPVVLFLLAAVAFPAGARSTELNSDFESEAWMLAAPAECAVCATISRLAKPGEPVGIWGWAADYYVLTGTVPATREAECARQIEKGPQQSYYQHRFLEDLRGSNPGVFVDATGPAQFRYEDRATAGHEIFPELRDYVRNNYQLVADAEGARVFVRKDLAGGRP